MQQRCFAFFLLSFPLPPPLFGRITVRSSFHLGIVYPLPLSHPPHPLSKHDVLLCPIMKRSVFCLEAGVGMCKAFHASPVASNSAYLSNFCLLVLSNICGTVEAVFMGLLSRDLKKKSSGYYPLWEIGRSQLYHFLRQKNLNFRVLYPHFSSNIS